jgi:hypothetical protein
VLQERGAPNAARSHARHPWPGVIWPDSARTLDLDASLAGELVVVRRVGERWGGAGALGLAPPPELTEAGQLRAAYGDDTEEGVEAEQQERTRERRG